ncbi:hypothetical protein P4S72_12960 [Vibrio sp. PP-XX7]
MVLTVAEPDTAFLMARSSNVGAKLSTSQKFMRVAPHHAKSALSESGTDSWGRGMCRRQIGDWTVRVLFNLFKKTRNTELKTVIQEVRQVLFIGIFITDILPVGSAQK